MSEPATSTAPLEGIIRNPANDNHFMAVKPVGRRVRAYTGDTLIAATDDAVWIIEFAGKALNPVIYVPPTSLAVSLEPIEKSTHCPLKGDATYWSFNGEEIGWTYPAPFDFSKEIAGLHAFWSSKVRFVIGD